MWVDTDCDEAAASSPHSSPSHGASRPMPMPVRSTSAGSTPTHVPQDSLAGVGGDVQEAFAQGARRNLRNDLLVAADSITNTMSSLVKELHSVDNGGEEEEHMQSGKDQEASKYSTDAPPSSPTTPSHDNRHITQSPTNVRKINTSLPLIPSPTQPPPGMDRVSFSCH
ncbi:hypothetical protein JZ751_005264 [Albula glossodonta]|uniref:Dystrobrevin beta n=1 Tax=Albula glossodonta TaxID=121402 RepID=A0A8T2P727_9TELE|nr:hypothetical protein JZ751_005264 [Albula glossodonta]